jgi:4-hydroxy-3-methylbut-2-enyl diphosphate reductase IspH
LSVAARHAGVNSNVLADEAEIDPLSGNAVLNGIPVSVVAAAAAPEDVVGAVPEGVAAAS